MNRVLITGADGFIGSHLAELLVRHGYEVTALAQYNSFNHLGWLEDIPCRGELEIVSGDIRDPFFCKKISKGADVIFHLAALIAIPYSYDAPKSYVDTNVAGTLNICQAALENGVGKLVHTSTSEVYGTADYVPIDEGHPLKPQSPYSASKISADMLAMSFLNAFDLPVAIARPFNTYGPRQSARAVIPTIISQIASGQKQIMVGDLSPTRDFNYVADTCQGFLSIEQCAKSTGEVINIGSSYEISILDTFHMIRELMGSNAEFVIDESRIRPKKSEVHRLFCDNRKLKALTGFAPSVSLRDGLSKTIDWFLSPENLARYKATVYNK
jgi:NAD dependent epimerase/dehydratase